MDEDEWDEAGEWPSSPDRHGEEAAPGAHLTESPTPGERLLYALGQLYWRSRAGELHVHPQDFDIENVARIIGVWRDVEFVQDDAAGVAYHFPAEVLCVAPEFAFPWYLLHVWAWAAERELGSFGTGDWR